MRRRSGIESRKLYKPKKETLLENQDRGFGMSKAASSKKYVVELIGTFVLVFIGCSSVVISNELSVPNGIGFVGIALAFGLSLLAMVYAIGGISGCHINPAVSISMLAAGRVKPRDTLIYIIAQCIGAVLAASVLYIIAIGNPAYSLSADGLGQNGYGVASPKGFSIVSGFIAEVVLTFIFLLVILASTSEEAPKGFAGISIGLTLVFVHLIGIPITGTSVNPARSLGPAVLVGGTALSQLWLFWVAPIIGGLIAAAVWELLK
jgi:aquaporin Z